MDFNAIMYFCKNVMYTLTSYVHILKLYRLIIRIVGILNSDSSPVCIYCMNLKSMHLITACMHFESVQMSMHVCMDIYMLLYLTDHHYWPT